MKRLRFVHTADVHLESPIRGVPDAPPRVKEILREATFQAFRRVIDVCLERQADCLLVAGDLYDSTDRNLRALARAGEQFERLADQKIPVFLCRGNYDPLGGWAGQISWPSNVTTFGSEEVEARPILRGGSEVARLYGISYATEAVTKNLAARFKKQSDAPWSIGLLHANVERDPAHLDYAPCRVADLRKSGLDYWALGHIHSPRVLRAADPIAIYPGTPQGRFPHEAGPRGCYVVEVSDAGKASCEFVPVDAVRWYQEPVSVEGLSRIEELISQCEARIQALRRETSGRGALVQWILTGDGSLERELVRVGVIEDVLTALREMSGSDAELVWSAGMVDDSGHRVLEGLSLPDEPLVQDFVRLATRTDGGVAEEVQAAVAPLWRDPKLHRFLPALDRARMEGWVRTAVRLGLDRLFGGKP